MFLDRFKRPEAAGAGLNGPPAAAIRSRAAGPGDGARSRRSNGLEQFFTQIRGDTGLNLLDLSGASQANIGFITNLGHRLYSEDLLATLDLAFGGGDFYDNQLDTARQEAFLRQNFEFPEKHFDGVLLWDVLEYLAPPLLRMVVERLSAIIRPGAYVFALFHAEERAEAVPACYYRIADSGTLLLVPRGTRKPAQVFNNRAVEKLFHDYQNVKFFLSRDSLREVIVRR